MIKRGQHVCIKEGFNGGQKGVVTDYYKNLEKYRVDFSYYGLAAADLCSKDELEKIETPAEVTFRDVFWDFLDAIGLWRRKKRG